jgi:acyl carrier protein
MALTRESILGYLENKQGVDISQVESDDTPLFSAGLLDSFSMVDLILFLETEGGFKMQATDVNLDNLDTIGRMLAYAKANAGA